MRPRLHQQPRSVSVFLAMGQSLMRGRSTDSTSLCTSAANDWRFHEHHPWADDGEVLSAADWRRLPGTRGAGPTLAFMRQFYGATGKIPLVIKCGYDSHGITRFLPPELRLSEPLDDGSDKYIEVPEYSNGAIGGLRAGGYEVVFEGFLWWQGSADGASAELKANYAQHLRNVLAYYRSQVAGATATTPWLIVRSPQGGINSNWPAGGDERHRAQETVGDDDPYSSWVSSDYPLGTENTFIDGTHPDSASAERIGVVMATEWLAHYPI